VFGAREGWDGGGDAAQTQRRVDLEQEASLPFEPWDSLLSRKRKPLSIQMAGPNKRRRAYHITDHITVDTDVLLVLSLAGVTS
jgi:hypothetical protein